MTTVAFVTYKSGSVQRRLGPMELEAAGTLAKELSRKPSIGDVRLEEWALLTVKHFENSA